MFLLSKIGFRRILVVFLVQITLFLGLALGSGTSDRALAGVLGVINRNADNAELDVPMDEVEYESAKASRREEQAKRSEQASKEGEAETNADKLNLEELTPDGKK